jgi:uncharacterized protein YbjT (DUF2867 family)
MVERVVVCGATGQQGSAVVRSLLASWRWEVVALSRSPGGKAALELERSGVRVVQGDLLDRASLTAAFRGASGVFGVTQPWSPDYKKCDVEAEVRQGRNIVDASREAGIRHLVLSTVLLVGKGPTGVPHVDSKIAIERYARESGVPLTIVRPGQFMDNVGAPYAPLRPGKVNGFVDAKAMIPFVACQDIGALVAAAFANPTELVGRQIGAVGELVSGEEIARTLSQLRGGEPFRYRAAPAILMWLFAREFHAMRRFFERFGKPPHPAEFLSAVEDTRRLCPGWTSMARHLEARGFASAELR